MSAADNSLEMYQVTLQTGKLSYFLQELFAFVTSRWKHAPLLKVHAKQPKLKMNQRHIFNTFVTHAIQCPHTAGHQRAGVLCNILIDRYLNVWKMIDNEDARNEHLNNVHVEFPIQGPIIPAD